MASRLLWATRSASYLRISVFQRRFASEHIEDKASVRSRRQIRDNIQKIFAIPPSERMLSAVDVCRVLLMSVENAESEKLAELLKGKIAVASVEKDKITTQMRSEIERLSNELQLASKKAKVIPELQSKVDRLEGELRSQDARHKENEAKMKAEMQALENGFEDRLEQCAVEAAGETILRVRAEMMEEFLADKHHSWEPQEIIGAWKEYQRLNDLEPDPSGEGELDANQREDPIAQDTEHGDHAGNVDPDNLAASTSAGEVHQDEAGCANDDPGERLP